MQTRPTQLLYRSEQPGLAYLPEGPYQLKGNLMSWVSIQTGPDSQQGALNILDTATGENRSYPLSGRPGFAFPTSDPNRFLIGLERQVVLWDLDTGTAEPLTKEIDTHTEGTIINDAVLCDEGLIFGAKDLTFSEQKAGLYFLRRSDLQLFPLRLDQICSNGKAARSLGGDTVELLDIDTPTQLVVRYELNTATGKLSPPKIVLDLSDQIGFPDGMIRVPDQDAVIIAMFNPEDAPVGHARQFNLTTGALEQLWTVEGSPQVTCPQLVSTPQGIRLVLTTATENMSADKQAAHPNAGCLFAGEIEVETTGDQPIWRL